MPDNDIGLSGNDISAAMEDARSEQSLIAESLKKLAKEARPQGLKDDERTEFLTGMTQPEFDLIHRVAFAMGPPGMNALERIMKEAKDI